MSEQRWIVSQRNYELDEVKYQSKLTPISKDQDPLIVDISVLTKNKKTTKNILKKGNLISKATSNPLENQTKTDNSTNAKKETPKILPHGAKLIDDYKHLQYSLIVNKNFNVDASMEVNWQSLKKI